MITPFLAVAKLTALSFAKTIHAFYPALRPHDVCIFGWSQH